MSDATSPSKKTKDDAATCVDDSATIPVHSVTRMLHFKVAGEKEAVEAEALLRKLHETMKHVDGFTGANRFVCKEFWDMKYFARFADVKALTSFMESAVVKEKVEPIIKSLEKISKDKKVHVQNFVADNWD